MVALAVVDVAVAEDVLVIVRMSVKDARLALVSAIPYAMLTVM